MSSRHLGRSAGTFCLQDYKVVFRQVVSDRDEDGTSRLPYELSFIFFWPNHPVQTRVTLPTATRGPRPYGVECVALMLCDDINSARTARELVGSLCWVTVCLLQLPARHPYQADASRRSVLHNAIASEENEELFAKNQQATWPKRRLSFPLIIFLTESYSSLLLLLRDVRSSRPFT